MFEFLKLAAFSRMNIIISGGTGAGKTTLLNMLSDNLLQERYVRHLEKMVEFTEKETTRVQFLPQFLKTAKHNEEFFKKAKYYYCDK